MKWTKERKIYAGLLAAGVVALAVDRLTSGPKEAAAEEPPASLVVSSAPRPVAAAPTANPAPVTAKLSERLIAWAAKDTTRSPRDPFTPAAAWAGAPANAPGQPQIGAVERFRAAHRLTGVLISPRQSKAMIDGRALPVGETLDGFRLISVTQTKAVLQSQSGTVTLTLQE